MATKKSTLAEIVASAKPVRRTVTLCVAGDLLDEHERLEAQLVEAQHAATMGGKLNSQGEVRRLAEAVQRCEKAMKAAEHDFTFEKLPGDGWMKLRDEHPARPGRQEGFNLDTFPKTAVAASCVSPEGMDDAATFDAFWEALNFGQRLELFFNGAQAANEGSVNVPFSATASAVLSTSRKNSPSS